MKNPNQNQNPQQKSPAFNQQDKNRDKNLGNLGGKKGEFRPDQANKGGVTGGTNTARPWEKDKTDKGSLGGTGTGSTGSQR